MSIFYDAGRRKSQPSAALPTVITAGDSACIDFCRTGKTTLRYAVRTMRNNLGSPPRSQPLSLALGIGANTAIFSLVDALLLKMLPVSDPQRLFVVCRRVPGADQHFLDISGLPGVARLQPRLLRR